ncbi:MAG: GNAT family N-acetyltransferase [Acidimicrobiia bacterium]
MPEVRRAAKEDAAAISQVHVRAWQVAYRGFFPDEFLDGLSDSVSDRVSWRQGNLGRPADRSATLVVSDTGGQVVGFVDTSPTRDDDLDSAAVGEVLAIYVSPRHWGQGFGKLLLEGAEIQLRKDGFTEAMLWVLTDNRRARRFYEALGWLHDGATKEDEFGGNPITEVRYLKNLS